MYSIAKVLLSPSLDENVHLPVLEAAACECPAIILKGTTEPEDILHAETGYISNNAYSMARWTIRALQNPQFRLGKLARQFVLDNFSWDKCVSSYKRIISKEIYSSD